MIKEKNKVFVGLSGGVDSSVAAYLLQEQGYDVVGVFLRCYNIDGCAVRDAEDARRVAEHLKIPFYVFDFEEEYKKRVVDYMISGYEAGLTPNPDVMCNKEIKFGLFLERALKLGADFVATGHYVRLQRNDEFLNSNFKTNSKFKIQNSKLSLVIARDLNKDQSYFLWTLTKEQIQHSLFPLGNLTKPEVRIIAKKIGLPTAEKKDSQGVCFLGMVDMKGFLSTFIKPERGEVRTIDGELVGYHMGVRFFTIGQRHLDIEPIHKAVGKKDREPYYVARKDIKNNILYVAEGNEHQALTRDMVTLSSVNILNEELKKDGIIKILVHARVRYRQPLFDATLFIENKNGVTEKCELHFLSPQKFVAEGQSTVFYDGEGKMIGGGIII